MQILARNEQAIKQAGMHAYMFFVFNFDAMAAQASIFGIERRQVIFLCWMRIRTRVSGTKSLADWIPEDKLTIELWRIKLKAWTQ